MLCRFGPVRFHILLIISCMVFFDDSVVVSLKKKLKM